MPTPPRLLLPFLVVMSLLAAACGTDGAAQSGDGVSTGTTASAPPAGTSSTGESQGEASRGGGSDADPGAAGGDDGRLRGIVRSLPLAEQAGQLVMTKLSGEALSEVERDGLRRGRIGGVIVFDFGYANAAQLGELLADVQDVGSAASSARIGVLVAADQEGGGVRALGDLPPELGHPALGRGSLEATYEAALAAGQVLARSGLGIDLAPVADLASGPRRIMAGRSFGERAATVAPQVAAWVRGMQEGGVSATVKHFPGFGAASENSDLGVARVERTRAELLDEDIAAFEPALRQADAVMISHGIYDGLGAELPASLAPEVVEPILREQLGYEGVAMTDSLNARGLREAWGKTVPAACAQAIKVGVDIALVTGSMETALLCRREIIRAVRAGDIPKQRLEDAVVRVLRLKDRRDLVPGAAD